MEPDSIFGEVIDRYTRAEAHADGLLIDVSDTEAAKLYRFPVSITVALAHALRRGAGKEPATFNARLWDFCYMGTIAAKVSREPGADVFYKVRVGRSNLKVWANCGPGDDAAPVMTFGFPEDR